MNLLVKREPPSIHSLSFADRARKALESISLANEERVEFLEAQLKEAKFISEDADIKYDEVIFAWVGCCACIMTSRPPLSHPYAARPTLSRLTNLKASSKLRSVYSPYQLLPSTARLGSVYLPSKFITKNQNSLTRKERESVEMMSHYPGLAFRFRNPLGWNDTLSGWGLGQVANPTAVLFRSEACF